MKTLEQRLRRIEEKVSSKKKVTEAVEDNQFSLTDFKQKVELRYQRTTDQIKAVEKIISYLKREYGGIFLRYGVSKYDNDSEIILQIYLVLERRELDEMGEILERKFSGVVDAVYTNKTNSKFNLSINLS